MVATIQVSESSPNEHHQAFCKPYYDRRDIARHGGQKIGKNLWQKDWIRENNVELSYS